jgi:hypothetical protein
LKNNTATLNTLAYDNAVKIDTEEKGAMVKGGPLELRYLLHFGFIKDESYSDNGALVKYVHQNNDIIMRTPVRYNNILCNNPILSMMSILSAGFFGSRLYAISPAIWLEAKPSMLRCLVCSMWHS